METQRKFDHRVQTLQERCVARQGKVGILQGYSGPARLFPVHCKVIAPMRYRVQAKPIEAALPEFYRLLVDGTIASQEPDGKEIVASMRRATLKNGLAEWIETCYCTPPLRHERATVYDRFFTDMSMVPTDTATEPEERSFWAHLGSETDRATMPEESTFSGSMIRTLGRNTV